MIKKYAEMVLAAWVAMAIANNVPAIGKLVNK